MINRNFAPKLIVVCSLFKNAQELVFDAIKNLKTITDTYTRCIVYYSSTLFSRRNYNYKFHNYT